MKIEGDPQGEEEEVVVVMKEVVIDLADNRDAIQRREALSTQLRRHGGGGGVFVRGCRRRRLSVYSVRYSTLKLTEESGSAQARHIESLDAPAHGVRVAQ